MGKCVCIVALSSPSDGQMLSNSACKSPPMGTKTPLMGSVSVSCEDPIDGRLLCALQRPSWRATVIQLQIQLEVQCKSPHGG